ncbi:unnamed protein product [Lymnaea stagnalis]|uniref:Uncharacterized protein n=1 Tax=Lymnaea stagnalis TaxID=6523 RepID=A0AAV2HQR1_LYMST
MMSSTPDPLENSDDYPLYEPQTPGPVSTWTTTTSKAQAALQSWTTLSTTATADQDSDDSWTAGQVAGLGVGCAIGGALLLAAGYYTYSALRRKWKCRRGTSRVVPKTNDEQEKVEHGLGIDKAENLPETAIGTIADIQPARMPNSVPMHCAARSNRRAQCQHHHWPFGNKFS